MRRSAPFQSLPRSAYEATLDLLAGRFPSDEFSRTPPAPRLGSHVGPSPVALVHRGIAVTSGRTIPDRGLFGVFVAGEGAGRRVGELDEEMVYESRVGDVFTLGTTSWRVLRDHPRPRERDPRVRAAGQGAVLAWRWHRPAV